MIAGTLASSCTQPCKQGTVDCTCVNGDTCDAGLVCVLEICTDPGEGVCGDGRVGRGEECDGNAVTNGACGANCRLSCNLGYDDCNGDAEDGCEIDIRTSLEHCGGCQIPCSSAGGTAACDNGNCNLTCSAGYEDCNHDSTDGCEVSLASDANNCGACGHSCLGGGCSNDRCLPMVFAAEPTTQDVALDADFVYYSSLGTEAGSYADGAVIKMSKTARTRTPLASQQKSPAWLALDETDVYWAGLGSVSANHLDGVIFAVAKTGGDVQSLAENQELPGDIALDATYVYWTTGGSSGSVGRVAKTGGTLPDFPVSGQPTPRGIVVDATKMYWTNRYGTPKGAVMVADLNGDNLAAFVDEQDGPYQLVQDATTLFWVNWETNSLMKALKSAGVASPVQQELGVITGIAVDGDATYWGVDRGQGASSIRMRAKGGGDVVSLATNIDSPGALAVDAAAVYWTSAAGIMRLAK